MHPHSDITGWLWTGGLAAIPLAVAVALLCRCVPMRPATRHALWAAVLVSFITPVMVRALWRPAWFRSDRVLDATDALLARAEHARAAIVSTVGAATDAKAPGARAHSSPRTGLAPPRGTGTRAGATTPVLSPDRDASAAIDASLAPASPSLRSTDAPHTLPGLVILKPAAAVTAAPQPAPSLERGSDMSADSAGLQPRWSASPSARRAGVASVPRAAAPHPPAPQPTRNAAPEPARVAASSPPSDRAGLSEAAGTPAAGAAGPATSPRRFDDVRAWLARMLELRDAATAMPPFPVSVWLVGGACIACVWLLRAAAVARALRRAEPADAETLALVEAAASELGVRRVPLAVFTRDRVSPLICALWRPRLVLPVELWHELDAPSRRAVVLHELAHLRRLDHWWCRVQAVVAALYWWHPVAWWASRRLRDEAEASCDAWVTALMPSSRRAYASALIATRSFLSVPGHRVGFGLGVMNPRTRRLARRLTMVMTQRTAPRMSCLGGIAAVVVLAAGLVVMPGLACPPDECESAAKTRLKVYTKAAPAKDPKSKFTPAPAPDAPEFLGEAPALESMLPDAPTPPAAPTSPGSAAAPVAPDPYVLWAAPGAATVTVPFADDPVQLDAIEQRLLELEAQLKALRDLLDAELGASRDGASLNPRDLETILALRGDVLRSLRPAQGIVAALTSADQPTATIVREYALPPGKLEGLVALMARSDVPIMVEQRQGAIAVHATEPQHRIFAAFVAMIHPDAETSPQAMIEQLGSPATIPDALAYERLLRGSGSAPQAPADAAPQRHVEELRRVLRDIERSRRATAREYERTIHRAEETQAQCERLHEIADELEDRADDELADAQRRTLVESARQMLQHALAVEREHDALAAHAAELEAQLEALEASSEEIEEQIEEIEESIEAQAEAHEHDADSDDEEDHDDHEDDDDEHHDHASDNQDHDDRS